MTGDARDPDDFDGDERDGNDREEIRAALAEIRRERAKAAFVHAALDAAAVALGLALLLDALGIAVLDSTVAPSAFASSPVPAPDAGTVAALLGGVGAFVAAYSLRTRGPAAEAFEDANPEVAEALRTARDAAEADRENPMARALYADVLDRLRETSAVGLLDATRLVATVALALALGVASVQTAVVGIDLAGPSAGPGGAGDAGATDRAAFENRSSADLRDGEEVLGDPTDVSAGDENLTASVDSSPGGEGDEQWDYDRDAGGDSGGPVEAERSGFASPERVEDADLVRRYARELEDDTDD